MANKETDRAMQRTINSQQEFSHITQLYQQSAPGKLSHGVGIVMSDEKAWMRLRDWFAVISGGFAFAISVLTAYLTYIPYESLGIIIDGAPDIEVEGNAFDLSRSPPTITFVNSGNRGVAILKIDAMLVIPNQEKQPGWRPCSGSAAYLNYNAPAFVVKAGEAAVYEFRSDRTTLLPLHRTNSDKDFHPHSCLEITFAASQAGRVVARVPLYRLSKVTETNWENYPFTRLNAVIDLFRYAVPNEPDSPTSAAS